MLTLGVDLSSQDANTAVCLLRWNRGICTIERLETKVRNDEIVALMGSARVTGIDAPVRLAQPIR
jgi:predicted nuclease with RNAse H fold